MLKMAPPAWAYQLENFDPTPDEELVCSICRGIFCNPVRSPCNHVFCTNCIFKWLENNRNCPICRKRTNPYDVQKVVPLIKNMIMKLTLKCHNLVRGCEEKLTLESCEAHAKECIYEMLRCKNKPCKEMVMRKDIEDHEIRDCLHRSSPCKKCGLKVSSVLLKKHNCIKALQKRLKCSMKVIKMKKQKIQDLKEEIKTLKDSADSSSDPIYNPILSRPFLPSESDISLSSTSLVSYVSDSEPGDESIWVPSTGDILLGLEHRLTQRNSYLEESQNLDDSIEVLRASTPQFLDGVPNDDLTVPIRRPPKRRLPALLAESSSDEASSEALDAFLSPKRAWSHIYSRNQSDNLASIPETVAGPSSVATTSAATNDIYSNLNSRSTSVTSDDSPATRSGGTFDRTLALLSRYNLESDSEWQPPEAENESDSSIENFLPSRDGYISSSDESSLTESDSDGSILPPTGLLKFSNDVALSSDDDPDSSSWMDF